MFLGNKTKRVFLFLNTLLRNLGTGCQTQKLKPVTIRERIVLMKVSWDLGQKKKLLTQILENPWEEMKVSVPPQQRPEPFTLKKIEAIVQRFRRGGSKIPHLSHFLDYVEFKFGTGLRTCEAAALRWRPCSSSGVDETLNSSVSVSDYGQARTPKAANKACKRNKERIVPLIPRLQHLLLDRRPKNWQAGLVNPHNSPIYFLFIRLIHLLSGMG